MKDRKTAKPMSETDIVRRSDSAQISSLDRQAQQNKSSPLEGVRPSKMGLCPKCGSDKAVVPYTATAKDIERKGRLASNFYCRTCRHHFYENPNNPRVPVQCPYCRTLNIPVLDKDGIDRRREILRDHQWFVHRIMPSLETILEIGGFAVFKKKLEG